LVSGKPECMLGADCDLGVGIAPPLPDPGGDRQVRFDDREFRGRNVVDFGSFVSHQHDVKVAGCLARQIEKGAPQKRQ